MNIRQLKTTADWPQPSTRLVDYASNHQIPGLSKTILKSARTNWNCFLLLAEVDEEAVVAGVLPAEGLAPPRAAPDGLAGQARPPRLSLRAIPSCPRMAIRRHSEGSSRAARRHGRHTWSAPIRTSTWSSRWRIARSASVPRPSAQSLAGAASMSPPRSPEAMAGGGPVGCEA